MFVCGFFLLLVRLDWRPKRKKEKDSLHLIEHFPLEIKLNILKHLIIKHKRIELCRMHRYLYYDGEVTSFRGFYYRKRFLQLARHDGWNLKGLKCGNALMFFKYAPSFCQKIGIGRTNDTLLPRIEVYGIFELLFGVESNLPYAFTFVESDRYAQWWVFEKKQ